MDNILICIKKMLGLDKDYAPFDQELIVFINSALMTLTQLGIGRNGFVVVDGSENWSDFLIATDMSKVEGAKTYVYIKTRLDFDPPANASLLKALQDNAKELEWRLNVKAEQEL